MSSTHSLLLEPGAVHTAGIRQIAVSRTSGRFATADTTGKLVLYAGGKPVQEIDLKPIVRKSRNEGDINRLVFSESGDLLYVTTGIDVVAVNVTNSTIAWTFAPKRMFGFLRSTPLDMVPDAEDGVIVSVSSGEIFRLDRKGRAIYHQHDNDAPQTMSRLSGPGHIVGGEGHLVHVWDGETGQRIQTAVLRLRHYSLAASPVAQLLAVRGVGRYEIVSTESWETVATIKTGAGLPHMAWSRDGGHLAVTEESEVTVWAPNGERVTSFQTPMARPLTVCAGTTDRSFLAGFSDGSLYSGKV